MPDGWPWGTGGALNGAPPSFFDPSLVPVAPWMNAALRPRAAMPLPLPGPLPMPLQQDFPPAPMPGPTLPQFPMPMPGPGPVMPGPQPLPNGPLTPLAGTQVGPLPGGEGNLTPVGFPSANGALTPGASTLLGPLLGEEGEKLPPDERSWLGFGLSLLDRPGAAVRNLLGGEPGTALSALLPFSGYTDEQRMPGQELLHRGFGMDRSDDFFSPQGLGGLAAELVTDPLNYVSFGAKTAGAKAAELVAGHLGGAESVARQALGALGKDAGAEAFNTANAAINSAKANKLAELLARPAGDVLGDAARKAGGTLESIAENEGQRALLQAGGHVNPLGMFKLPLLPLQLLPAVGIPNPLEFINKIPGLSGLELPRKTLIEGQPVLDALGSAKDAVMNTKPGRFVGGLFDSLRGVTPEAKEIIGNAQRSYKGGVQSDIEKAAAASSAAEMRGNLQDVLGQARDPLAVAALKETSPEYAAELEEFRKRMDAVAQPMPGKPPGDVAPAPTINPATGEPFKPFMPSEANALKQEGGLDPKNVLERIRESEIEAGQRLPLGSEQNLPLKGAPRSAPNDPELENSVSASERMFKGEEAAPAETAPSPREGVPSSALSPTGEGKAAPFEQATLPTGEIAADPERFQYKLNAKIGGATGSTAGRKYNPDLAGTLDVWRDPEDGKTYVVNGHNRLDLAKRNGVDSMNVRYLPAATAEEARAKGALINIAEGHGNAFDAATFFRETGMGAEDMSALGVKPTEGMAQDGLKLAGLSDGLFKKALTGELPIERAAMIGAAGLQPEEQSNLLKYLSKKKNWTNGVLQEALDTLKSSGTRITSENTLFGVDERAESLFEHRMQLQAKVKELLSKEKNVAGFSARNADTIEEAGMGKIDALKAQGLSDASAEALYLFDKYKQSHLSPLLDAAAERVAGGGKAGKIAKEILRDVKDTLYENRGNAAASALSAGDENVLRQNAGAGIGAGGNDVAEGDAAAGSGDQGFGAARAEDVAGEDAAAVRAPGDELARMLGPGEEEKFIPARQRHFRERYTLDEARESLKASEQRLNEFPPESDTYQKAAKRRDDMRAAFPELMRDEEARPVEGNALGEMLKPGDNGNEPLTPREGTHVGPLPEGEGDALAEMLKPEDAAPHSPLPGEEGSVAAVPSESAGLPSELEAQSSELPADAEETPLTPRESTRVGPLPEGEGNAAAAASEAEIPHETPDAEAPPMPDQRVEQGLRAAGMEQREAVETAARALPKGTSREGLRQISDALELGLKGGEPEKVKAVVDKIRDRYDAMQAEAKAGGVAAPELKSADGRKLLYTTHTPTENGAGYFADLAGDVDKQLEVYKSLYEKRRSLGITPDEAGLVPREAQLTARQAKMDAAGIKMDNQPVPDDLSGIGLNQLKKVSPEGRQWLKDNGMQGEFLKFSQEFGTKHESMIPRLDAYRDLTVSELNDVFEKHGATGPVFNENPYAQLATREMRHARAMNGADLLNRMGSELGKVGDVEEEIKWKPSSVEGVSEGRNAEGEKVFGIPELNDIREKSEKPPIYFDDPQTAKVLLDSYKGTTETEKVGQLLHWYDSATQVYKAWLIRAFPASHMRMNMRERMQMYLKGMPIDAPEVLDASRVLGGKALNVQTPEGLLTGDEVLKRAMAQNVTRDTIWTDMKKEFIANGGEVAGAKPRSFLDEINPLNKDNAIVRGGEKLSALLMNAPSKAAAGTLDTLKDANMSTLSERNRLAMFMWELKNGKTDAEAARSVSDTLYSYGKEHYSDFENGTLKRALWFYPHMKHTVALTAEAMLENLGAVSQMAKLGMQPGGPERKPEFTKPFMSLPHGTDKAGNSQVLYDLGTPLEFSAKALTGDILEELNPLIKAPLELATGRDFFLHKDIADANKAPHYADDLPSSLQSLLGVHDIPTKNGERTIMNPWARYAIDASPLSRISTTASRLADPQKSVGDDLVNLLSGSRTVSVDEGEEEQRARRQMIIQRLKEKEREGTAGEFTSFSGKDAEAKGLVKMLRKY